MGGEMILQSMNYKVLGVGAVPIRPNIDKVRRPEAIDGTDQVVSENGIKHSKIRDEAVIIPVPHENSILRPQRLTHLPHHRGAHAFICGDGGDGARVQL